MAKHDNQHEEQIAELTGDLQRVQADFVNYKRRAEQEKAEILNLAKTKVIREFLTPRDNLDKLVHSRPTKLASDPWAASVDALSHEFDAILSRLGVTRFESLGHRFDPHMHDAITMDDGDGRYEVVTGELQAGYKLGDEILRHAMVKVGRTDTPPPEEATEPAPDPVEVLESEEAEPDEVQPEAGK